MTLIPKCFVLGGWGGGGGQRWPALVPAVSGKRKPIAAQALGAKMRRGSQGREGGNKMGNGGGEGNREGGKLYRGTSKSNKSGLWATEKGSRRSGT